MEEVSEFDIHPEPATATARWSARLRAKLLANRSLPKQDRKPSRQALRRATRVNDKKARQHHNEEIRKVNKPKVDPMFPGTRAERRKYLSKKAPDTFVAAVQEAMMNMARARAGLLSHTPAPISEAV